MRTNDGFGRQFGMATQVATVVAILMLAVGQTHAAFSSNTVSGLAVWFEADAGVLTNSSGAVTNWLDQSGNGRNATQTTTSDQPTYVASALNGKPVIRFDGVNDKLVTANLSSAFPTAATLFVVATISNDTAYDIYYNATAGDSYWRHAGSGLSFPAMFRTTRIDSYCAMPTNGTIMCTVKSSSGNWEMRTNGVSAGVVSSGSYSSGGIHTIAGGATGGALQGDIAEVLIYNHILNSSEESAVGGYLARKYGLNTAYVQAGSATGGVVAVQSVVLYGTGSPFVQWQKSADGSAWTDISGATSTNLDVTALYPNTPWFRVHVSGYDGPDAYSTRMKVTTQPIANGSVIIFE
jgi:hypothetical protein